MHACKHAILPLLRCWLDGNEDDEDEVCGMRREGKERGGGGAVAAGESVLSFQMLCEYVRSFTAFQKCCN